jgi:hypothetical protein
VEVDEDSGDIALRWMLDDPPAGFSFILRGDGNAVGVKTMLRPEPRTTFRLFNLTRDFDLIERYIYRDEVIRSAVFQ